MFEREEKALAGIRDAYTGLSEPDAVDIYIRNGIRDGIGKKRKAKQQLFANIAAILILAVLTVAVRISPVFAAYVSKVPGLNYIVKLVNYDKGLVAAVENNFVQRVNISKEQDGIVFDIKDVIIDSSKAVLFYSIENRNAHGLIELESISFTDAGGKALEACVSWGTIGGRDTDKEGMLEDKVELDFVDETKIPDILFIDVKLRDVEDFGSSPDGAGKILEPVWHFELPVDKKLFESSKKVYSIDQSIEIEGQKIRFHKATVTPTKIAIELEYDEKNTKRILRFDDIAIINEKGERWATIMNGVSGSRVDENHEVLYFQSNYYTDPHALYITGSSIRALDKDKLQVEVDIDRMQLIKAPDSRLVLDSVKRSGNEVSMEFSLTKDQAWDEKYSYFLFGSRFQDGSGNMYDNKHIEAGGMEGSQQRLCYIIAADTVVKNPVRLTIEDYPARIKGYFKLQIK